VRTLRPSSLSRTLALAAPAVSLVATRVDAAFDAFIKFDTIKGESTEKVHRDWCEGLSFSFGTETPVLIGGGGSEVGKPKAAPLILSKRIDKASPQLFLKSVMGQNLPTLTLELSKSGSVETAPVVFYKIVLTNAFVSKIDSSGTAGDNTPTESIQISYEKISIIYSTIDAKGTVVQEPEVTWNFAEDKQ